MLHSFPSRCGTAGGNDASFALASLQSSPQRFIGSLVILQTLRAAMTRVREPKSSRQENHRPNSVRWCCRLPHHWCCPQWSCARRGFEMTDTEATVLVVDDDRSIRRALQRSLSTAGYAVETFGTVDDLIASPLCAGPGCLLLDVRLREMSGLDLPDRLRAAGHELPVIYMTGYGDVPTSVRAMKAGAVDFLPKPLETDDVLAAVERAMAIDR